MAVALAGAAPQFASFSELGGAPDQPPARKSVENRDCRHRVSIARRPCRHERFTKRRRRLACRRETPGWTLFKETQDYGFERTREIRAQHTWRHDRGVDVL